MQRSQNLLFVAALMAIYVFGSYASLEVGLTWDELPEFFSFFKNVGAVVGLLHGDASSYKELVADGDRYYGMGFHFPAHFFQLLLENPVASHYGLAQADAYMLSKHWVIFSLFFGCGFVVRNLVRQFTGDELFSKLAMIGFLLWPYVFGHALFNIKDIPFMCAWLLCTGYSFSLARRYCEGQAIGRRAVCLLAILTGWLISIRVAGILIFLQYALTALLLRGAGGGGQPIPHPLRAGNLALFAGCLILFVYAAYPLFWLRPSEVLGAIAYMSHHPMEKVDLCTRTFGVCMKGVPPVSYIPLWLSVKLPIMVLAGCLISPLVLIKTSGRKNEVGMRLFKAVWLSSLSIPVFLAIRHVVLYNEIRQILFLMPLLYCVGVVSLYHVSRRIAVISLLASMAIFIADHYLSFPYQYIWFNEIARQYRVEKYFETDYWGASGRGLAKQLVAAAKEVGPVKCIYADPVVLVESFLPKALTGCYQWLYDMPPKSPRPYLTASFYRTTRVVDCREVRQEKFRLFLGKGDILLGKVQYCD